MTRCRVFLNAVVSATVDAEADSPDEAIATAQENGLMFLDHTYPDVGESSVPSDLFPGSCPPADDCEEITGP